MPLFNEFQSDISIYRYTIPTSGFTDPAWALAATIKGRIEPVAGDETWYNQQNFQNVSEVCFCPVSVATQIQAGDGVVDEFGIERKIVGPPEIWRNLIPYCMFRLERAQWSVT